MENIPLETENIRLKETKGAGGRERKRKREGVSREERGWNRVGRGVLGLDSLPLLVSCRASVLAACLTLAQSRTARPLLQG